VVRVRLVVFTEDEGGASSCNRRYRGLWSSERMRVSENCARANTLISTTSVVALREPVAALTSQACLTALSLLSF